MERRKESRAWESFALFPKIPKGFKTNSIKLNERERERYKGWRETTTYTCRLCDRRVTELSGQRFHKESKREMCWWKRNSLNWDVKGSDVILEEGISEIGEIVSLVIGKGWRIAFLFPIFIILFNQFITVSFSFYKLQRTTCCVKFLFILL